MNPYLKFSLMLLASFIEMYAVMFFNVAAFEHVMLSYTRTYMTLLMIAPMAIVMLLFMWEMYKNKAANIAILLGSAVIFVVVIGLLRTQTPIKDVQYMKAMIPHHSSAIMVSQNATFEDPETEKLAKDIIEAQEREIAQMKKIIDRLKK